MDSPESAAGTKGRLRDNTDADDLEIVTDAQPSAEARHACRPGLLRAVAGNHVREHHRPDPACCAIGSMSSMCV